MHVSRRSFDRRIDLKWFREDLEPVTLSNFQKTDFLAKNGLFFDVFRTSRIQIFLESPHIVVTALF